jgi:type I restriction enzyme, S subunit
VIDDEIDLPAGWHLSKLGDATNLVTERTDPSDLPSIPYIGLEHVEAHTMRLLGRGRGSDVRSTKTRFSQGDVLYGKLRPYLNKVARPGFEGICSTDFLVFRESKSLDAGYLANYLNQLWVANRAHRLSSGVELPRVDWRSLSQLPIAYPSDKSVQRSIVERINLLRISRSSALERLGNATRALRRFRSSVLAAACTGRLTAGWRDSAEVESADAVLDRKRMSDRKRLGDKYREPLLPDPAELPEIPDTWAWAALPELGELARGKSKHRPRNEPSLYGGSHPFIQTGDIARSSGRILTYSQTYNELGLAQSRIWPERTVCITIAANIADSALLTFPACFPDSVVGLIADETIAVPEYVELFIRTARRDLLAFAPATAQANINLAILSTLAVALPPFEEQHEIVKRVDEIYAISAKVETAIEAGLRRVEQTSQGILTKAFRGEFTNGPDNAR